MPAVWTDPITWEVDQLVTNDELNEQVRDNLEYLLTPNFEEVIRSNGGNYQNAAVTTFADIDSTNLTVTLVTHGGRVLINFGCVVILGASEQANFDIAMDGTRIGAAYTEGLKAVSNGATGAAIEMDVSIVHILDGLAAGTYVFRPQWATGTGDTVDMISNTTECPIVFQVTEL